MEKEYELLKKDLSSLIEANPDKEDNIIETINSCQKATRESLLFALKILKIQDYLPVFEQISQIKDQTVINELIAEIQGQVAEINEQQTINAYLEKLRESEACQLENPDPDFAKRKITDVFVNLEMEVNLQKDKKGGFEKKLEPVMLEEIIFCPDELSKDDKIGDNVRTDAP